MVALLDRVLEDMSKAFGLTLKALRARRGYTQAQLAVKAHVSRAHLRKLEAGKGDFHMRKMVQMAIAFEMPVLRFYFEIENRRTQFTPDALRFEREILPGGIVVIPRTGRIDISKEVAYLIEVYTFTKERDIFKVLFDLSTAECDFSSREEYRVAEDMIKWMTKNSYWPIVAVVHNTSLGDHGATVARDRGLPVGMFRTRPEALEWLEREPLQQQSPDSSFRCFR